jgi:hypothetical protein
MPGLTQEAAGEFDGRASKGIVRPDQMKGHMILECPVRDGDDAPGGQRGIR